ncbi:phosphotransferase [Vibrio stylophorae]|uniref:phosphotransferase n=1 Tax=Vibrio stylophorae TaxID=659351 RepID=UPI001F2DDFD5|nr:phosphotransferase [Vibrio stylophorae]
MPHTWPEQLRLSGHVTPLTAGTSGQSYRLRSRAGDFVWYQARRDFSADVFALNARRQGLMQAKAAQLGLAMKPQWFGLQGVLTPWLSGAHPSQVQSAIALPTLLVRLHQSAWRPALKRDLAWQVTRYEQALSSPQFQAHFSTAQSQLMALAQRSRSKGWPFGLGDAFCHLDAGPHNLIVGADAICGDGVCLIDWEYAATADIAMELAMAYRAHGECGMEFLKQYQRLSHLSNTALRRVFAFVPWVDYIALLWAWIQWPGQLPLWGQAMQQQLLADGFEPPTLKI